MDFSSVDFDPVTRPTVVIAMTARTGSTQLRSLLGQLGPFGSPREFLNTRGPMHRFVEARAIRDMRTYFVTLAADAPIFCLKATVIDWMPIASRARTIFPAACHVYLDRRDIDALALSVARAVHSGVRHARRDAADAKSAATAEPPPADLVSRCKSRLIAKKDAWARYFGERSISPLRICFEDLAIDFGPSVRSICDLVGVALGDGPIPEVRHPRHLGHDHRACS